MYFIGYDIGSSSVKACLVEAKTGAIVASDFFPKQEMEIVAKQPGWAEQNPEMWWENLKLAHEAVLKQANVPATAIEAIGITWQMHGLVLVDKDQQVLRDAIIWCDSRAVPYGEKAFKAMGEQCLSHLLNSPGNFTASKLAWVKEHEPALFKRIDKLMLPGDYIAMKLSGEVAVTIEGLSEGIFWDFKEQKISEEVLNHFGIPREMMPPVTPIFGMQARVNAAAAAELGLKEGTPITYRAGDQPNNAYSLQVMEPGDVAANAGTSGVVYGIQDRANYDPHSRVNSFAHVNYTLDNPYIGVLLCINGTGILNSWLKRNVVDKDTSYNEMNELAATSPIGAKGVTIVPFGNGAERVLKNEETNCSVHGVNFNIHSRADLLRAAQEGIVFSYEYGLEVMREMGMEIKTIKAGYANMFLSEVFSQTLANVTNATIELYNTDGAAGAARGAGVGVGHFKSNEEAFQTNKLVKSYQPDATASTDTQVAYQRWKNIVTESLKK